MSKNRYQWAATGDVNAFFGLMLDNIAGLVLTVSLLAGVFKFPEQFAIRYMIPGTAIGVLVGDLLFFVMAFRLAKRTGHGKVTAMPLGLDTPSTFGMVLFVLGPAYRAALPENLPADFNPSQIAEHYEIALPAAMHAWQIGICCIVASGIFKLLCSIGSGWTRRVVPRAGLLGSLAAIALVLIGFLPLMDILALPLVGIVALAIILVALTARMKLPFKIPGALASLIVAGGMFYLLKLIDRVYDTGLLASVEKQDLDAYEALLPYEWLHVFSFEWVNAATDSLKYLPIVIPFALATVIGGIDCTESAAAAGDDYYTGSIISVEAVATVAAGLCGGVIQTTPYIGHPAYKAMGGRAAYTLATALFVGGAGLLGYFGFLYLVIPKAAVFPILVFIGIEITSQSFHATPTRHYPAVAFACLPALAVLANLLLGKYVTDQSLFLSGELLTIRILSGGFIITSLIWASALAAMIDRKLKTVAIYFVVAGSMAFFGVIHSPYGSGRLFLPFLPDWVLSWFQPATQETLQTFTLDPLFVNPVYQFAIAYFIVAVLMLALSLFAKESAAEAEIENLES